LIFAAISSTGATIAAVLAVCGSCCTAMFDAIVGDDNDSETDEGAENNGNSSQKSQRFDSYKEEEKMSEDVRADEYRERLGGRQVSFKE